MATQAPLADVTYPNQSDNSTEALSQFQFGMTIFPVVVILALAGMILGDALPTGNPLAPMIFIPCFFAYVFGVLALVPATFVWLLFTVVLAWLRPSWALLRRVGYYLAILGGGYLLLISPLAKNILDFLND
jgi:hypothetical protein